MRFSDRDRPPPAASAAAAAASVGVIGGGFCGAAFALHLLRDNPGLDVRLTIFEPRAVLGAGLAYSTTDPEHRINVAAARMSPFPEAEGHFDAWLRARGVARTDPAAAMPDGRLYPCRAEYGRYIDAMLRRVLAARPRASLRHVASRVAAARREAGRYALVTEDGARHVVDLLVIAAGHPPPVLPAVLAPLAGDARLVADPWDRAAIDALPRAGTVMLVGSGLTACDVVASLRARGFAGQLIAVSRHGLLPRPRTTLPVVPYGDFVPRPGETARDLLRRVRAAMAACAAAGRPWEDVVDALRRQGKAVWGGLPHRERLRLLRHLRAYWDVHRFQCAPQIDARVRDDLATGRLVLLAATLRRAVRSAQGIEVTLHPRRAAAQAKMSRHVDAIVACTGPGHTTVTRTNPALASLAAAGVLRPDPYGLGIEVDRNGCCIDASGGAVASLFVAGPLARGTDGELMGLPQVSTQPRAVAARVARLVARRGGATGGAAGQVGGGGGGRVGDARCACCTTSRYRRTAGRCGWR